MKKYVHRRPSPRANHKLDLSLYNIQMEWLENRQHTSTPMYAYHSIHYSGYMHSPETKMLYEAPPVFSSYLYTETCMHTLITKYLSVLPLLIMDINFPIHPVIWLPEKIQRVQLQISHSIHTPPRAFPGC